MEANVTMKRFLSATALIFCLMFGQAQAADVYATTENNNGKITDVYVVLDTKGKAVILKKKYGIKVMLRSIGRNHPLHKNWGLGFKKENGDLYAVLEHGFIDDVTKQVTRGNTILSSYYWDIFKTAMEHS